MSIVVLTGASGSGKTTIAKTIANEWPSRVKVLHFDSIGVPSHDEMIAKWGSSPEPGGAWQREMTLRWTERIAGMITRDRPILFEGQMRPLFVKDALQATGILNASVILVDCDDVTRTDRLSRLRNQPEWADASMMSWATFLRCEAEAAGYEIFDTSRLSLETSVAYVSAVLASKS